MSQVLGPLVWENGKANFSDDIFFKREVWFTKIPFKHISLYFSFYFPPKFTLSSSNPLQRKRKDEEKFKCSMKDYAIILQGIIILSY